MIKKIKDCSVEDIYNNYNINSDTEIGNLIKEILDGMKKTLLDSIKKNNINESFDENIILNSSFNVLKDQLPSEILEFEYKIKE